LPFIRCFNIEKNVSLYRNYAVISSTSYMDLVQNKLIVRCVNKGAIPTEMMVFNGLKDDKTSMDDRSHTSTLVHDSCCAVCGEKLAK